MPSINALKNIGATTATCAEFARRGLEDEQHSPIGRGRSSAGRIKQLFIFGGDPVYKCAALELSIDREARSSRLIGPDLQKTGARRCAASVNYEDCDFGAEQLARSRLLTIWKRGGTHSLRKAVHIVAIQPMILPLFGGLSEIELLSNAVLGAPKIEGPAARAGNISRHSATRAISRRRGPTFLRDGFRFASARAQRSSRPSFQRQIMPAVSRTRFGLTKPPAPTLDSPEIVLVRSYCDGRRALH